MRRNRIDRSCGTPLWVQLKTVLETAIYSGVLAKGTRLPSEQVLCDAFALSRPVVRVYRVDGAALTHTEISLPAHRLPGMEKLDIENRSIFDTINRHYGLKPQRADRWIKAAVAVPPVAERMGVEPGTPLLRIESVAFDFNGNALEYYDAYYNPDVSPLHIATDPLDATNVNVDVDGRLAPAHPA